MAIKVIDVIENVTSDQSRYAGTDVIEYEDGTTCQKTWEVPEFPETDEDQYYEVKFYKWRLDLIADEVYGNQNLWWVIAAANNIIDPFMELNPDDTPIFLRIPSPEVVFASLTT